MISSKKFSLLIIISLLVIVPVLCTAGCTSKKVNMPVVLLNDFGSEDYRVSQLKGIIYNAFPEVNMIDASEDVPGFDIPTGAFILDIAAKEFPANTVFVSIVAPYAQTDTKYLVLTTEKDQIFVLPDNGLLTWVAKDMGVKSIYRISNQSLFDKPIAQLAAERIQGIIGARIASGYPPQNVGTVFANPTTLDVQIPAIEDNKLLGTVVYVDHFGNGITNVSGTTANEFGIKPGDTITVNIAGSDISTKYGSIYSDVAVGKEIVFVNNNLDILQLSINMGNFASTYKIVAGTKFEIYK